MKSTLTLALSLGICCFAACGTSKKTSSSPTSQTTTESKPITERKWKLIELSGKPVADKVNGKEPFLRLDASENRYSASGGCNGLGGAFTLEDNGRIKFSQGMSTMMACENMEIEHGLNKALIAADNYTVGRDTLSLNKARMAPLARFVEITDKYESSNTTLYVVLESLPATPKLQDSLMIRFTVHNPTKDTLKFTTYHTPFEGFISMFLDVTNSEGEAINYIGPMAKRVMPPPTSTYHTLAPGQSESTLFNLKKGYKIATPGTYTLQYNGGKISGMANGDPITITVVE